MTVRAEGGRSIAAAPRVPAADGRRRDATAAAQRRCVPVRDPGHRTRPGRGAAGRTASAAAGQTPPAPPSAVPRPSGTIEAMTVPGRVDAASLLLSLDPPPWFVRHARAVAEVAGWLAARIEERGIAVDRRLVEAAALLHDADKALPADDPARAPPARRRVGGVADAGRPPGAGAGRGEPPGDPPARRRAVPSLGGVRDPRGTDRRLRGQACRPAPRDRWRHGSPRGVAAIRGSTSTVAPSAGTTPTCTPSGRGPTGSSRTSAAPPGSGRTRSAAWAGPARRSGSPAAATHRARPAPVDDHGPARVLLGRRRAVRRARGRPVRGRARRRERRRRWTAGSLRGNRNMATGLIGELHGRVATPVMFGGGTLAIVMNPGALVVKGEDRDAFLAAIGARRAGQRAGDPRCERVRRQGARHRSGSPTPSRRPAARSASSSRPRGRRLAGWIEAEARERGLQLAPGAAKTPRRAGRWLRPARPTPSAASRPGSRRWSSTSSPSTGATAPIGARRRPGARRRGGPGLGLGVHRRRRRAARGAALDALDRLLETTPEPVLLAVLHRRVRELIETGDRLRRGRATARVGKAMGVNSEFRMDKLRDQARLWTTDGADRRARRARRARRDGQGRARARIGSRRSDGWRSVCG